MSKIIATDHFDTQNWDIDMSSLGPFYADLIIRFTDVGPVIEFKDLQFKYELRQGDNIKRYGTYPQPHVIKYVRTDQTYLVMERLNNLVPDQTYQLYLWAKNNGKSFEKTVEFTVPRPTQPYESWTWDGDKWEPPVPRPEGEDSSYSWNETDQKWVME